VSDLVGLDELAAVVDEIDSMFDWYHSLAWLGYCFGVTMLMMESLTIIFGSLIWQGKQYNVEEDDS